MNEKYCHRCGSPVPGDAKFCTKCGAPVVGSGNDAPAPRNNHAEIRALLIAIGVLALLVAAIWVYGVYSEKKIECSRQDSIRWERGRIDRIKAAYKAELKAYYAKNDKEVQTYYLYDITGDGTPELWIKDGLDNENHTVNIYTYEDETLKKIGELNSTHCHYFYGKDYVLQVGFPWFGCGNFVEWRKITYDGNNIKSENIYTDYFREFVNGEWVVVKKRKEPIEPFFEWKDRERIYFIENMRIKE